MKRKRKSGALRGTMLEHTQEAQTAVRQAGKLLQKGDCFGALHTLGYADAHVNAAGITSGATARKMHAVEDAIHKRCRIERR